ncbi:MAG TPA: response regulator [Anaerolineales bacterium]|nr:response regulator [Anaerolineales bacterium]
MLTRVLVIDDDIAMTEMLKVTLEPRAFEVFTAHTGEEGIKAAKAQNPDVIILDLFMPGMDGWQVCKSIRRHSQVPILVLSAINKPGTVAKALDEGADDYLIKPVPSGVLVAHLNNLIRRARAERDASDAKDRIPFR